MIKLLNILKENILVETEVDSLDEKWSEKYKKSINCNNPKGFSQKAHCQGRKKKLREDELIPDEEVNNFDNEYSVDRVRIGTGYITFMGLDKEYNPDPNKDITIIDGSKTYTFKPDQVNLSRYDKKNIYISTQSDLLSQNKKSEPPFDSKSFKLALQTIFPEYWKERTTEYSAGLRGIYEFSNDDDWSILNYFDTNPHRLRDLNTLFLASTETDPILWLKKLLTDKDNIILQNMLKKQKNAVYRSDNIEKNAMLKITENVKFFPKGHLTDRYDAIDAIDLNTGLSYQIKAAKDVVEVVDEETGELSYLVTGERSRFSDYKNKKKLNKILYYVPNTKTCYVFDNENYDVKSNDEVIHYGQPEIY